jgi:uncharacterized protein
VTAPVVADAGPLIGLARVGLLPLLQQLYETISIPPQVYAELQVSADRPGSKALSQALEEGWLVVEELSPLVFTKPPDLALDAGEAEVVLLAEQRACRFVLIDEKRGRAVAKKRGLRVVGTAGVLFAAKEKGLLDRVSTALDRLAAGGYHLSPHMRLRILDLAGEE